MPAPSGFLSYCLLSVKEYLNNYSLDTNTNIPWEVVAESPEIQWTGKEYGRISASSNLEFGQGGQARQRMSLTISLILIENTSNELDDTWFYDWLQWLFSAVAEMRSNGIPGVDDFNGLTYSNLWRGIAYSRPPVIQRKLKTDSQELATISYQGEWTSLSPFYLRSN